MSRNIALSGLFTALTIAGAQITIPLGPVPFTLQLLFVIMSGQILGAKWGFYSQASYVFLGAMGLPVFAGMKGGLAHIIGPTGGYILSFPLAALISGLSRQDFKNMLLLSILSIGVVYACGSAWLTIYTKSFVKSIMAGVLPFIWVDLLKTAGASYVSSRLLKAFPKLLPEKSDGSA